MSENDGLWVEVDLAALRHNYREIKEKLAASTRGIIAVVKANGYGHGLLRTGLVLEEEGAAYLAVSHLGEGRLLRAGGVQCPILVMTPQRTADYAAMIELALIPTIDRIEDLKALEEIAAGREIAFHLKLNTGMNRFGLNREEIEEFCRLLRQCPDLRLEAVFSHLATALSESHPATTRQIENFAADKRQIEAAIGRPVLAHLANSAGALAYPKSHYDFLRVGTLLYGQYPASYLAGRLDLKNTWAVKARIISTREVKPRAAIGYGGDCKARRKMTLGVLPVGYRDGFGVQPPLNNVTWRIFLRQAFRLFRNFVRKQSANHVLLEGKQLPVIGRIAMQTTIIDIGGTDLKIGDVVEVPMRRIASSPSLQIIYKDADTSI